MQSFMDSGGKLIVLCCKINNIVDIRIHFYTLRDFCWKKNIIQKILREYIEIKLNQMNKNIYHKHSFSMYPTKNRRKKLNK